MIILALILFGLALGSSINALVWRLRLQELFEENEQTRKHPKTKNLKYSMVKGRSMCPHCEYQLEAKDLIPVLSWLWLRGKCRKCRKSISVQYPLVELGLAVLFVGSYFFWPLPLEGWYAWVDFAIWLAGLYGLTALFVYDLRWSLLPDKIVAPLIVLAVADIVLLLLFGESAGSVFATIQFYALGLLPVAGVYYLIHLFSKGRMVGFGDVKLGVFIGLSLGWPAALLVLVLSNVLGTLYVLPSMLAGKLSRKSRVPFGPFLICAYVIAGLWGDVIIEWYLSGFAL